MATALILYADETFFDAALAAKSFLNSRGFQAHMFLAAWLLVEEIPHLASAADVTIWYSHGAYDGPVMFRRRGEPPGTPASWDPDEHQISPWLNTSEWPLLMQWFKKWVRPRGLFVSHACHSAGSNRFEDPVEGHRWVRELARAAPVYAVGVEGPTSAAHYQHAVALLDFAVCGATPKQATRVYGPGGHLIQGWLGWNALQPG